MPKEPKTMGPARTVARLVYSESDLSEQGQGVKDAWARAAEDADAEGYWVRDWATVMRAFRQTEGALRGLNAFRVEEGEDPLADEDQLSEWFEQSVWDLAYVGAWQGCQIRVWSYPEFDGRLAFAVARDSEGASAVGTDIY